MAGHSQFKNIMHRKGAQDKKRAKLFSRLSREISIAAKMGGDDPDSNARLRLAIKTARLNSMPKSNIDRAVSLAKKEGVDNLIPVRYEGYAAGGIAVIVEALTDNKNRTFGNVRTIFSKNGGNIAESGAVVFMFDHLGCIAYQPDSYNLDCLVDAALDAGATDYRQQNDGWCMVYSTADDLGAVAEKIEEAVGDAESASLVWRPNTVVTVEGEVAHSVLKLIDALENDDDVQNVFANFDIDIDILDSIDS